MNRIKHYVLLFIIAFFLLTPAFALDAQMPTPVARVVWIKGTLTAVAPNKETRSLQKTSIIYLHDELQTDSTSQAQIVFSDNTLLTFKPSTKFYVDQYSYQSQSNKHSVGKFVMNLIEGGFRTITGLIAKSNPADYQVNTPVATIGVRGTDYAVSYQAGQLFMAYYAGTPCLNSKNGASLCLSVAVPFGGVTAGGSPVPLKEQPAVFKEKIPVEPAPAPAFKTAASSSVTTAPAQTTITPKTPAGTISSFCITN